MKFLYLFSLLIFINFFSNCSRYLIEPEIFEIEGAEGLKTTPNKKNCKINNFSNVFCKNLN